MFSSFGANSKQTLVGIPSFWFSFYFSSICLFHKPFIFVSIFTELALCTLGLVLLNLKPLDSKASFQNSNLALAPHLVSSIKTILYVMLEIAIFVRLVH